MPVDPLSKDLFKRAVLKRRGLYKRTQALRLINGIGDGLDGLILEQYDRHFVAQVFNSRWKIEAIRDLVEGHFEADYLIIKDRTVSASSRSQDMSFTVVCERASSRCVVNEQGHIFEVDLNDTLNTGLFLDMRANRQLIADACRAKTVLNCFAYTCSFGVYARLAGAAKCVNVDISRKVLDRGRRNYELNGIDVLPGEFIKMDAVSYLHKAVDKKNRFDVIILDPPSFARGEKVFSVEKNLPELIESASRVLNPQGAMLVATNLSTMTAVKLEKMIKGHSVKKDIRRMTPLVQDEDFVGSGQFRESHLTAFWVEY